MMPERIWAASLPVSTGSIRKWDEHHQEYAFTSEDEYIRADVHEAAIEAARREVMEQCEKESEVLHKEIKEIKERMEAIIYRETSADSDECQRLADWWARIGATPQQTV